jgi:hypothetical protein
MEPPDTAANCQKLTEKWFSEATLRGGSGGLVTRRQGGRQRRAEARAAERPEKTRTPPEELPRRRWLSDGGLREQP